MCPVQFPAGYPHSNSLSVFDTQCAIGSIHSVFPEILSRELLLKRVSAPLFVDPATGLNDNLNGTERPVTFEIPGICPKAEVVHSLAKWKRYALHRYGFTQGTGLYTCMNAIRRDETVDNLHSIYVDQWDWEAVIPDGQRNEAYLKKTVQKIVHAICETAQRLSEQFPGVYIPSDQVSFITTQELENLYPELSPKQREDVYLENHPTAFIMQIGGLLASGTKHDGRAPDYDDWKLNGDIVFWNPILKRAFEVSSMGIRVDAGSMKQQLKIAGCEERRKLPFHQGVLNGTLPLTVGGGIGQSRLCMLLLGKAHIGEVQCSLWDPETLKSCGDRGITLL